MSVTGPEGDSILFLLVYMKEFPSCLRVPEGVPIVRLSLALKEFPSCLLVYLMEFPFCIS